MGANMVMSNVERNFKITERVNFQMRLDANNLFNHQTLLPISREMIGCCSRNSRTQGRGNQESASTDSLGVDAKVESARLYGPKRTKLILIWLLVGREI